MKKVAVMGDLHFPSRDGLDEGVRKVRDEFYRQFLDHFMKEEADYYVSVGDLVEEGTKSEYDEMEQMIERYNKPFYHVFGNHDLLKFPRRELFDYFHGRHGDAVVETDEAFLVFLETAQERNKENFGGTVTKEQLHWLRDVILSSGEKTMLLFAHHPVDHTTRKSDEPMFHIDPEVKIWDVLKEKKGTGIYINGHNHNDSIAKKGNWHFVQLCCVLDSPSIRIFEITEDACVYQTIPLTDSRLKEKADILLDVVPGLNASPNGPGATEERHATFITKKRALERK